MTNSNCLAGLRCPKCGNSDRLFIHGNVRLDVTDDGAEVADGSDWHWDEQSLTICPECDRDGPLAEFQVDAAPIPATVTLGQIIPHTDLGDVKLSRAGLRAFHAARDTNACAEYAIAAYLKAAGA